jgi:hypothetical protein
MSHLSAAALLILQRQRGFISAGQLRRAGVGDRLRARLVTDRVLEHRGHSVYGVVGVPRTLETRAIELCLQHPAGFITGPTGGALLALRRMPRLSQMHFCVPHGARFDAPNHVMLRQSTVTPEHHVRRLENGIRIASFERLAFDLGRDLGADDLSSVIEQMIQRKETTMEALGGIARELCSRRRSGSLTFATVLLRRTWGPAAESDPELTVLTRLRRLGVPVEPQTHLVLPNGRQIDIDMAVPAVRWAVEVDAHPDHLMLEGSTSDKRRDRQLHLIDWQVERVGPVDLLDLGRVLEELAALYEQRCRVVTV